jgi:hypothetical protein
MKKFRDEVDSLFSTVHSSHERNVVIENIQRNFAFNFSP